MSGAQEPLPAYVLAGGRSRRMGRDKARVEVGGVPMALRVARALRDGGAGPVHLVGKDPDQADLGLPRIPDPVDDHHPLVGVAAALDHARTLGAALAVVAPCDLPALDAAAVQALLAHGGPCTAAATPDWQPLLAVLATDTAPALAAAAAAGASVRRALAHLPRVQVPAEALRNANRPADLDPDRPPGR